ncbi:protein of unknown function [Bryocella elongata]|uniref:DUF3857 domain-containing protein n=1 Tax=Bryocella elongata TaxID=863522 RepID=A0A1H6AHK4_9BACT|nr:DUF3857 domain-containing protein [Bryocella elongata]SEG47634.1 protein of unknown function [Bryocella elongata]
MTAEPKAPGAPSVMLSYDEVDDASSAEVTIHVRIKILTEAGLRSGTIELPPRIFDYDVDGEHIVARTIHADGTIIPFNGKPHHGQQSENSDADKTFISMPSVEVGSILEYICHFDSQNRIYQQLARYYAPIWRVQRTFFVKQEHFLLKFASRENSAGARWVSHLPPGADLVRDKQTVRLDLADVPAYQTEPFMPPADAVVYRVRFFYFAGDPASFWALTGTSTRDDWNHELIAGKDLQAAVHGLLHEGDTEDQKLRRLYAAVMTLENTDFTRERSAREDKKSGIRTTGLIDDVWIGRRGTSYAIAMLFIAMARVAGFDAFPMVVASRNRTRFDEQVLTWSQLDSTLAVVSYKGKLFFLDPGMPACPYGVLAPWHLQAAGFAASTDRMSLITSPAFSPANYRRERAANLLLAPDGSVTGTVTEAWVGGGGIALRLVARATDATAMEKGLEESLRSDLPSAFQVKLTKLEGVEDGEAPLIASFEVSGKLGTVTPRRLLLPAQLFQTNETNPFTEAERKLPISFPEIVRSHDQVKIRMPAGLKIDFTPDGHTLNVRTSLDYASEIKKGHLAGTPGSDPNVLLLDRVFAVSTMDFPIDDYPTLRKYFGDIATADQEQIVLSRATAEVSGASAAH